MDTYTASSHDAHQLAVRAAQIRCPLITVERARGITTAVVLAVVLLVNGVVASVGFSALSNHGGSTSTAILAGITMLHALLIAVICAAVLTVEQYQPAWVKAQQRRWTSYLEQHLPTRVEFSARRTALQQAVDAAAEVVSITQRLAHPDQFTQWRKLSEIDSAIESMVMYRTQMCTTDLTSAPSEVRAYVDAARRRYDETLTPQYLAEVVRRYLVEYVERNKSRSYRVRDLDTSAWGYLDMSLRFNCRTNIDWILLNAWRIGPAKFFDEDEPVEAIDMFRAWWSVPLDERPKALSYEKILMHAPLVVYKAMAWDLEHAIGEYPISNTLSNITDSSGAPVEYVMKLWRDSVDTASFGRIDLERIVRASRKIAR